MKRRSTALFLGMSAALLALASPALARDGDDVVLLKSGGRVRGTVMEEDPKAGVSIRLLDGTTRKLKAAEVKSIEYGKAAVEPVPAPAPVAPAPPAPAPPPVAYYGAPGYPYGRPPAHLVRRSTGLFVTGLVLLPLGAIAAGSGIAFALSTELKHDDETPPAIAMLAGGSTFMITGMIFTIVGGGKREAEGTEARVAPIQVSPFVDPHAVGLRGSF